MILEGEDNRLKVKIDTRLRGSPVVLIVGMNGAVKGGCQKPTG